MYDLIYLVVSKVEGAAHLIGKLRSWSLTGGDGRKSWLALMDKHENDIMSIRRIAISKFTKLKLQYGEDADTVSPKRIPSNTSSRRYYRRMCIQRHDLSCNRKQPCPLFSLKQIRLMMRNISRADK